MWCILAPESGISAMVADSRPLRVRVPTRYWSQLSCNYDIPRLVSRQPIVCKIYVCCTHKSGAGLGWRMQ